MRIRSAGTITERRSAGTAVVSGAVSEGVAGAAVVVVGMVDVVSVGVTVSVLVSVGRAESVVGLPSATGDAVGTGVGAVTGGAAGAGSAVRLAGVEGSGEVDAAGAGAADLPDFASELFEDEDLRGGATRAVARPADSDFGRVTL